MAQKQMIFKCEQCGHIIEVVHEGSGELVCCDQPMVQCVAKTEDQGSEKHVPVITQNETGTQVVVGSTLHPMEEKHYIEWVELEWNDSVCKIFLAPGKKPEVVFDAPSGTVRAREYCSVHGLWKTK